MHIPMEICDLIVYHVWNAYNYFLYLEDDARHYSIIRGDVRRDLAALRLVNTAFCRSASPWLFRHINAKSSFSPKAPPLERIMKLSQSPYALHVCQLDFGFKDTWSTTSSTADMSYIEDLSGCLSSLLVKFPNLAALDFDNPPSSLPQDQRRVYMDTVASVLRYVPLPNLTELEIKFPITHDFGRFFPNYPSSLQIPFRDIVQRLQHLGLYVCAYTDQRDQRFWLKPILPEYAALPNDNFASRLFRIAETAPNLESLAIHSVNILDIDFLAFPPSLCLRSLQLGGVSISSNTLHFLLNQFAKRIRYINFWLVKLKSGTWQQVLLHMCKLPLLLDINFDHVGYSPTGSSSHLASIRPPDPEYPLNIETEHSFDLPALGVLQRQVNSNRIAAGFQPFSADDYRHMNSRAV